MKTAGEATAQRDSGRLQAVAALQRGDAARNKKIREGEKKESDKKKGGVFAESCHVGGL